MRLPDQFNDLAQGQRDPDKGGEIKMKGFFVFLFPRTGEVFIRKTFSPPPCRVMGDPPQNDAGGEVTYQETWVPASDQDLQEWESTLEKAGLPGKEIVEPYRGFTQGGSEWPAPVSLWVPEAMPNNHNYGSAGMRCVPAPL